VSGEVSRLTGEAMAMTSRDVVSQTVRFQGADRLAYALPEEYSSDFTERDGISGSRFHDVNMAKAN
jgi:hypothetical protein